MKNPLEWKMVQSHAVLEGKISDMRKTIEDYGILENCSSTTQYALRRWRREWTEAGSNFSPILLGGSETLWTKRREELYCKRAKNMGGNKRSSIT